MSTGEREIWVATERLSAGCELAGYVLEDFAMFVLWAEQNDLGGCIGADAVAGRPVEHVSRDALFRGVVGVGDGEVAADDVAPVG